MTNEHKAQRLDEMSTALQRQAVYSSLCAGLNAEGSSRRAMHEANQREQESDAALLRETAAMMRERGAVQWEQFGSGAATIYLRRLIVVQRWLKPRFRWDVNEQDSDMLGDAFGYADTLEAAQAAAVAWVDGQEGK